MNNVDASQGALEAFAGLKGLISVITDPEAAQCQADAIRAQLAEIAGQRLALAADREAFAAEKARARAEIEEERASAARIMAIAVEEKQVAAAQRERAEAYAKKIGYWEPPTSIAVGPGGLTRSAVEDAPPTSKPGHRVRPPRNSDERFGPSTLTRQADD